MEPGDTAQASLILNRNNMQNARLRHYVLCKMISLGSFYLEVFSLCTIRFGLLLLSRDMHTALPDSVGSSKRCLYISGPQAFWHQGPVFYGRQFFHRLGAGDGLGMIQAHYTYCALYFFYCYIRSTSDHQALDSEVGAPSVDDKGEGSR